MSSVSRVENNLALSRTIRGLRSLLYCRSDPFFFFTRTLLRSLLRSIDWRCSKWEDVIAQDPFLSRYRAHFIPKRRILDFFQRVRHTPYFHHPPLRVIEVQLIFHVISPSTRNAAIMSVVSQCILMRAAESRASGYRRFANGLLIILKSE